MKSREIHTWIFGIGGTEVDDVYTKLIKGTKRQALLYMLKAVKTIKVMIPKAGVTEQKPLMIYGNQARAIIVQLEITMIIILITVSRLPMRSSAYQEHDLSAKERKFYGTFDRNFICRH